MNIALITTETPGTYPSILAKYITSLGVGCHAIPHSHVHVSLEHLGLTPENTLVHARAGGPDVNPVLASLEAKGYVVLNDSATITLTNNKYESQIFAGEHGIPIAQTYKIARGNLSEISELASRYGSIVAKPIYSKGRGKYCKKIDRDALIDEIRVAIEDIPGDEFVVQERIHYSRIIRTIVVGGVMIAEATAFDTPERGEWKATVCLNLNIKKLQNPSAALIALAEKTAKTFGPSGAEISFIDFFETPEGGFVLNELNTACNLRVHERVTGVPVHRYIADHLVRQFPMIWERAGYQ